MNIQMYLSDCAALIDNKLNELIPERNVSYNVLFEAARYSLIAPCKRLRPILALATTEALGGDPKNALTPACSLELVHTYSLIHDDLPSMDNDDLRRGKPTLHKVYPEGHAVLAGDFLLTHAFEILSEAPNLSYKQRIRLIHTLAQKSGDKGMIAGQIMDLEAQGKKTDLKTLQEIHSYKTAAMISASIEFGAIVANATEEQTEILKSFGKNIGLAFQIVDDILDLTSSEKTLGKPIGSDIVNNKITYPSLMGLEKSKKYARELYESSLSHLSQLKMNSSNLSSIAEIIIARQS